MLQVVFARKTEVRVEDPAARQSEHGRSLRRDELWLPSLYTEVLVNSPAVLRNGLAERI